MKLTSKSLKLAGTLALALIGAAPVALSTAANAAPLEKPIVVKVVEREHRAPVIKVAENFRYGYDARIYNDRFHRPPLRFEPISVRPIFARTFEHGHWAFYNSHWHWIGGRWVR
ncbi:MAG TPA: hypothetical protein VGG10_11745 [Rhizomicrobium sp.]